MNWALLALLIIACALLAFMVSGGGYLLLASNDAIDHCTQSGGRWDATKDQCAR